MLAHHKNPLIIHNNNLTEIRKRWQQRKQQEMDFKFKHFRRPF